jgi:hypothetical protein
MSLGDMTGKTIPNIIAVAGNPSSVSDMNGLKLLQWQEPGCHLALLFDVNGIFIRFTHQHVQYVPADVVAGYKTKQAFSMAVGIVICIAVVVFAMLMVAHQ